MGREALPFGECPPEIAQRCNALYSRHQVRLSDERCVMGRCNLPSYYKRLSAEDRRNSIDGYKQMPSLGRSSRLYLSRWRLLDCRVNPRRRVYAAIITAIGGFLF